MKNINYLLVISIFMFYACSSDEDSPSSTNNNNQNPGNPTELSYENQDLQGQIEGENWTYKGGIASTSQFTGDTDYTTFISIGADEQDTSGFCTLTNPDSKSYVLFSLKHENSIVELVEKTLSLDFSGSSESFTVTLVSYSDTSSFPNNRILTNGKLEILAVDTMEQIISGRMAVEDELEGDANNVNGNFSVYYCDF